MPPAKLQQLLQEALTHHGAGRLDQADKLYRQARIEAPRHFDVLHLSGTLALQQGRYVDAVDLLSRALPLNTRSAVCAMRLGTAYASWGRHAEAEENLRIALRRQPDLPEAWDNLGYVLKASGRLAEAIPCHERAVAIKPDYVAGWYNLGLALQYAGRLNESLAAQDRAIKLAPTLAKLHYGRAMALQQGNRIEEAIAGYDAALTLEPSHLNARSYRLMALNYTSTRSVEQLWREHRAYGATFPEPKVEFSSLDLAPERPLHVAFISPDFRTHSIAYFIEPLLRHLDRKQFHVTLYHDHFTTDEVTHRLQNHATVWRNFVGLGHDAVEAQIREDAPDILIDLAGHTGMNRLPVFARRVAPVQISYLGYPNTTGLTTMDYRFTDEIADPPGISDEQHTEHLVRFAPTAWAYQPLAECPPVVSVLSTPPPGVTFGCFNNFGKVSEEVLVAWAHLLKAVPRSRLRLKAAGLADAGIAGRVRELLATQGIAPHRIEMLERTAGLNEHLMLYHGVDVALDTFPYNGTTTTCEALWMGVPVVTLRGDRHAARVGASLLQAIGRPEWIAANANEYVAIAAELAQSPENLVTERIGLRARIMASPLGDHQGQAQRFGEALRGCWRARCQQTAAFVAA